jgi:glycosyltransferase involved in cell wall biosynthesis
VDDGSTDNTRTLCEKYDIRYIYQDNAGVSAARNIGVREAAGDWIAFLDSDDRWHPCKLALQIALAESSEYSFIHSNELWIRNNKQVNPPKKHTKGGGDQFLNNLNHCMISPSTVLLKKSLFEEIGGFLEDYPVCEDYDLWLKITSLYEVGFISESLIDKHGGHVDQLSQKFFAMDYFRIKSLYWIFKNRDLNFEKRNALLDVTKKKCGILIKGYLKHQNLDNLQEIQFIFRELNDVSQV